MLTKIQSFYGFTKMPFGRDIAPASCTATQATPRPSPGSPGPSPPARSPSSPARSARERPRASAPPWPASTPSATAPSTWPTRPASASAASASRSSSPAARPPASTPAPCSPRPPTPWPPRPQSAAAPPVLILDEAHQLDPGQLETIRTLTSYDLDTSTCFAGLLIGQPALRAWLRLGVLAALDQRIALRAHLDGMTREETASYISHYLTLAGRGSDTPFSDDAITLIHDTSRGLPRTINNLCIAALIAACAAGHAIADQSAARAAITEVTATPRAPPSPAGPSPAGFSTARHPQDRRHRHPQDQPSTPL